MCLNTKHSPHPDIFNIMVSEERITPTASCCNAGVVFVDTLSFETHISSVCKTSFWQLRNIWRIRTYLEKSVLQILIHAFITNKLVNCNFLLTGIPKYLIKCLQSVQNVAACLVSGLNKHSHYYHAKFYMSSIGSLLGY